MKTAILNLVRKTAKQLIEDGLAGTIWKNVFQGGPYPSYERPGLSMSGRAMDRIKILPGSPVKQFTGKPSFSSTATPQVKHRHLGGAAGNVAPEYVKAGPFGVTMPGPGHPMANDFKPRTKRRKMTGRTAHGNKKLFKPVDVSRPVSIGGSSWLDTLVGKVPVKA